MGSAFLAEYVTLAQTETAKGKEFLFAAHAFGRAVIDNDDLTNKAEIAPRRTRIVRGSHQACSG